MSEYLGFEPSGNPFYYFLSYNSEDKEIVSRVAQTMVHSGINLWYDYGIDYGEGWEEKIVTKIKDSQGVILLFTKGILAKKMSYVQKEYKIAQFLNSKIYVVFVDEVKNEEVPLDKISWFLDVNDKQNVNLYETNDVSKMIERLGIILGIATHEDKMNKMIDSYNKLYFEGHIEEASKLLKVYVHDISLKGKVNIISNLIKGGVFGNTLFSQTKPYTSNESAARMKLLNHMNKEVEGLYEEVHIGVNNDTYIIGNDYLFHRGNHGDAHVIWIWKNGELIHTIGGLVDAYRLNVYWDSYDNIVYITYLSDYEPFMPEAKFVKNHSEIQQSLLCITAIENPNEMPTCTDFKFIDIRMNVDM